LGLVDEDQTDALGYPLNRGYAKWVARSTEPDVSAVIVPLIYPGKGAAFPMRRHRPCDLSRAALLKGITRNHPLLVIEHLFHTRSFLSGAVVAQFGSVAIAHGGSGRGNAASQSGCPGVLRSRR
jgi:hypothetical protein